MGIKVTQQKKKTEQEQITDAVELVKRVAEDQKRRADSIAAIDRARAKIRKKKAFTLIPMAPPKNVTCF